VRVLLQPLNTVAELPFLDSSKSRRSLVPRRFYSDGSGFYQTSNSSPRSAQRSVEYTSLTTATPSPRPPIAFRRGAPPSLPFVHNHVEPTSSGFSHLAQPVSASPELSFCTADPPALLSAWSRFFTLFFPSRAPHFSSATTSTSRKASPRASPPPKSSNTYQHRALAGLLGLVAVRTVHGALNRLASNTAGGAIVRFGGSIREMKTSFWSREALQGSGNRL
jgi:hypothetical protein